jgi:hypothetical protein
MKIIPSNQTEEAGWQGKHDQRVVGGGRCEGEWEDSVK